MLLPVLDACKDCGITNRSRHLAIKVRSCFAVVCFCYKHLTTSLGEFEGVTDQPSTPPGGLRVSLAANSFSALKMHVQ